MKALAANFLEKAFPPNRFCRRAQTEYKHFDLGLATGFTNCCKEFTTSDDSCDLVWKGRSIAEFGYSFSPQTARRNARLFPFARLGSKSSNCRNENVEIFNSPPLDTQPKLW
jgi:hypothetical protein